MRRLAVIGLTLCAACRHDAPAEPVGLPGLSGTFVATSCVGAGGPPEHAMPCEVWGISSQSSWIDSIRLVLRPDFTADFKILESHYASGVRTPSADSGTVGYGRTADSLFLSGMLDHEMQAAKMAIVDSVELTWHFKHGIYTSVLTFKRQ